jgi:hypothetical protein
MGSCVWIGWRTGASVRIIVDEVEIFAGIKIAMALAMESVPSVVARRLVAGELSNRSSTG